MDARDNGRAIAAMLAANAVFMVNDALVKAVGIGMPLGQVMALRGAFAFALLLVACQAVGVFRRMDRLFQPAVLLRTALETTASFLYLYALLHLPVANSAAILQALPLVVTAGAAVFLGAPVGWRRWLAILIGLAGVMLIIRPGLEGFSGWALVTLSSVVFMGARDLVTRRIPPDVHTFGISIMTIFTVAVLGGVISVSNVFPDLGGWKTPDLSELVLLALCAGLLVAGYILLIMAVRIGDISVVAPFRYSSVLWAMGMGFLLFGEVPDHLTLLGTGIIIATGVYMFLRERRVARLGRQAAAVAAPAVAPGPVDLTDSGTLAGDASLADERPRA